MLKPLLIPLALMLVACTYPKEAREPFGSWGEDPEGLPYYEYTGGVPFTAYDENGNRTELPEDPYFLLGNYRIGLIPHASGMYQILTAERGWARLNASEERPDYGVVESSLGMPLRMVSGVGFSRWEYNLEDGINCRRVLSVRPSEAVNEGMPAYCVDVTFSNESDREKNISFTEAIPVNYSPMYSQMQENPVLGYKVKAAADGRLAEASITAELLQYTTEFSPSEATPLDFYPPSFYLQKAGEGEVYASGNTLGFRADVVLQPGQSRTLTFIGGIGKPAGGFLDGTEASAFGRFPHSGRLRFRTSPQRPIRFSAGRWHGMRIFWRLRQNMEPIMGKPLFHREASIPITMETILRQGTFCRPFCRQSILIRRWQNRP